MKRRWKRKKKKEEEIGLKNNLKMNERWVIEREKGMMGIQA